MEKQEKQISAPLFVEFENENGEKYTHKMESIEDMKTLLESVRNKINNFKDK